MITNIAEIPISIIIPVYNGEKYLRDCLDSIFLQTLINIEIIIINDGSTDTSKGIIQEYEQRYKDSSLRMIVIHQENQGRMPARKNGLAIAKGEYIGFLDCDDWVQNIMFENLYKTAKKHNSDIVSCGFINVDEEKQVTSIQVFNNSFEQERAYKILPDSPPSLCNSIFRRELFDKQGIEFYNLYRGEDLAIVPCLHYYAKNTVMIQEAYYYYRNIDDSFDKGVFSKCPVNLYKDLEGIENLFQVANSLANFFEGKDCLASDLLSYTTKFPDFFNRYNYKYVRQYFTKHDLWDWYFAKLLALVIKHPQYYQAHLWNVKQENKVVISCFKKVFGRLFTKDDVLSSSEIFELFETAGIVDKYIASFRLKLAFNLFFDFFIRVKEKLITLALNSKLVKLATQAKQTIAKQDIQ